MKHANGSSSNVKPTSDTPGTGVYRVIEKPAARRNANSCARYIHSTPAIKHTVSWVRVFVHATMARNTATAVTARRNISKIVCARESRERNSFIRGVPFPVLEEKKCIAGYSARA